jgi:hypothetical protein
VLLTANPIDDIHNARKISAVVTDSRFLDSAALGRTLAQVPARPRRSNVGWRLKQRQWIDY